MEEIAAKPTAKKSASLRVGGKKARKAFPVKKTINLAEVGVEKIHVATAIPAVILIILLAGVFGKYGVADRLAAMNKAEGEAASVRSKLAAAYDRLEQFGELENTYAHYTYSSMSEEELGMADRSAVIELIENVVMPEGMTGTWSLTGNQLTLNVKAATLQDVNLLVQEIEKDDLVSFCTVLRAEQEEAQRTVPASALILSEPEEADEESEDASESDDEEPEEASEPADEGPEEMVVITETYVTADIIAYLNNRTEAAG